ncbi:hypothetical protein BDV38DRAFT_262613 [Aspergillus pseudotamarii]|uniref:Uncharacterized protein n=1 Tax=Aspergillus pseudotamarii TaxID=132259 RepID=A0A5N6SB57_ASPPS|nr:uncharacterized protein BDV38DRAFT_262613 [Aspergillus pseudotamarii]KAE8131948.1 hypothetical protein BDV38DRAFT_262613 [Aspergillus pseudotamarii]
MTCSRRNRWQCYLIYYSNALISFTARARSINNCVFALHDWRISRVFKPLKRGNLSRNTPLLPQSCTHSSDCRFQALMTTVTCWMLGKYVRG